MSGVQENISPEFFTTDWQNITEPIINNFISPIQVDFARNGLIAIPLPIGAGKCRALVGNSLLVVRGEKTTEHKFPCLFDRKTGEEVCVRKIEKKSMERIYHEVIKRIYRI